MISVCFQGKPFNITVIQVYALNSNAEVAEIKWFDEDLQGEGNGNPLQYSCLENPMDRAGLVGCSLWGRTESDTTEAT